MKKRITVFLSLVMIFGLVVTGCQSKNGGKLVVGVRDDIRNFSFYNEKANDYYGLEDDIARELAKRLGYSGVEFKTVLPENRKQLLLDGEIDCLIAIYSNTKTRIKNFDFSDDYYTDKSVLMVQNSSRITDVDGLKDKTVGIMNGSNTGPELAIRLHELGKIGPDVVSDSDEMTQYQGITVKKYPSYDDVVKALEIGEIDAAALDGCIAQTYMNDQRSILDFTISEQHYGVATQKDSELSKQVKKAIKEMKEDGTIKTLIDKWN